MLLLNDGGSPRADASFSQEYFIFSYNYVEQTDGGSTGVFWGDDDFYLRGEWLGIWITGWLLTSFKVVKSLGFIMVEGDF